MAAIAALVGFGNTGKRVIIDPIFKNAG
ncbi:uncharacterized protein G2W53_032621 [Senna tora]|uniref:Uncharacterized protein n=1 Tax=Senna tora TaxID=362788 RepID=A0A834SWS1_9FABA|nr:uncharacterized protein G2W53_032621 [Senna tora]